MENSARANILTAIYAYNKHESSKYLHLVDSKRPFPALLRLLAIKLICLRGLD